MPRKDFSRVGEPDKHGESQPLSARPVDGLITIYPRDPRRLCFEFSSTTCLRKQRSSSTLFLNIALFPTNSHDGERIELPAGDFPSSK
jgi:hypothetical protein